MRYTQHFIVEGKPLGEAPRSPIFCGGYENPPPAYSFFCPVCADVWARCPVLSEVGSESRFQVITKECRRHSELTNLWLTQIPGSLHLVWDDLFTRSFPHAVLERELFLHIAAIEKERT